MELYLCKTLYFLGNWLQRKWLLTRQLWSTNLPVLVVRALARRRRRGPRSFPAAVDESRHWCWTFEAQSDSRRTGRDRSARSSWCAQHEELTWQRSTCPAWASRRERCRIWCSRRPCSRPGMECTWCEEEQRIWMTYIWFGRFKVHKCYSTVTCKVFLNWPHCKLGHSLD